LPEDEPSAAAVSPVVPDKVLLEAEDRDDCTAAFPTMGAVDETAVRLLCCILLVWERDSEVAGCELAVFGVMLLTGICSDSGDVDVVVSVATAEGAIVAILDVAGFLMRLWCLRPWGCCAALERRWLEMVEGSLAACCRDDEIALCAKADDVTWSEIGIRPIVNDSQTPETADAKSLRCCVADDLIGRMVDILRVARRAIRRHQALILK
jgi:hypothetical protein